MQVCHNFQLCGPCILVKVQGELRSCLLGRIEELPIIAFVLKEEKVDQLFIVSEN